MRARAPLLPQGPDLISLVTTREEISDLLALDDVIDLVIPRGGNALVSHIQRSTRIPVLGHADGICHAYVDVGADLAMAQRVVTDAKVRRRGGRAALRSSVLRGPPRRGRASACQHRALAWGGASGGTSAPLCAPLPPTRAWHCVVAPGAQVDYPAACNAVEKVLVHAAWASKPGPGPASGLVALQRALEAAGVKVRWRRGQLHRSAAAHARPAARGGAGIGSCTGCAGCCRCPHVPCALTPHVPRCTAASGSWRCLACLQHPPPATSTHPWRSRWRWWGTWTRP